MQGTANTFCMCIHSLGRLQTPGDRQRILYFFEFLLHPESIWVHVPGVNEWMNTRMNMNEWMKISTNSLSLNLSVGWFPTPVCPVWWEFCIVSSWAWFKEKKQKLPRVNGNWEGTARRVALLSKGKCSCTRCPWPLPWRKGAFHPRWYKLTR